jgi:hypothetical protein
VAGEQSAKSMAPRRIGDLRLRIANFRLTSKESIQIRFVAFPFNPKFEIRNPKLSNHLVRPVQQ